MYQKEKSRICMLYAVSPVHAGSGSSLETVDLPIQRERHTRWPLIQASGVKGALRAHFEQFHERNDGNEKLLEKIFGIDSWQGENDTVMTLPGAISVSDAKLLAFPMRASIAPFVWVTSPEVLRRFFKDLQASDRLSSANLPEIPTPSNETYFLLNSKNKKISGTIILEDIELTKDENYSGELGEIVSNYFDKTDELLLVSDQSYRYCVQYCTEVQAQIKIDSATGTTANGSLRYEELLPTDSLMYFTLFYGDSRTPERDLQSETIINHLETVISSHIQMGGDETLGRGIFELEWK